jgi:hypothetical protein
MPPSPEIPLSFRAVIIAYRFDLAMQYSEIAKRLSIHHEAVKSLCQRVQKRCSDAEQPQNASKVTVLLEYIEDAPRLGRPRVAEPGSDLSVAVRRGAVEYPKHERELAARQGIRKRQALGELSPNVQVPARQQIFNICEDNEHRDFDPDDKRKLVRYRALEKILLDEEHKLERLEYCDVVDTYVAEDVLIVYTDEKKYYFGGSSHPNRITAGQGERVYDSTTSSRFMLEQWAAGCAGDTTVPRPHCCWDPAVQNNEELAGRLAAVNKQAREEVDARRLNCKVEGSPEWTELRKRNEEIRAENTRLSFDNLPKNHRLLTPARLYPYEDFKVTGLKGKLNFVWYAYEVYEKLLFPYVDALRKNNTHKDVVVVEDNAPSHLKARKLLAADIRQKGIHFTPHPGRSPDFNLIETIQKYHQKELEDYSANISSSAAAVKAEADAKMKETWQSPEMDICWQNRGSNEAIKLIADRCRMDEGGNHFVDDINTSL